MALFVEIVSGPGAGSRYFIDSGQTLTLGRAEAVEMSCPSDALLSNRHCTIKCEDDGCLVRDLGSANGTFINGARIAEGRVRAGDWITAGSLQLTPVSQAGTAAVVEPRLTFLNYLRSVPAPLFCLLDAACSREIFKLIEEAKAGAAPARIESLYDGKSAIELAVYAPYLVQLTGGSALLPILMEKGWGKGWASYFVSRTSFEDLRHHFRKFLLVKLDSGQEAYFRFYDPRVLREYLPTCNAKELDDFFGPLETWMIENKDPEILLRLASREGRLSSKEITAGVPAAL